MSVSSQVEDIMERIVWIAETRAVRCWGNEISKAVVRIVPHFFNLLVSSREQPMGILEHLLTIVEWVELPRKQFREMGWRCLLRSENLHLHEAESVLLSNFPMNIFFWNCRGALNPHFHSVLLDLLNRHSPAIVVVTEIRVGGERAKDITDRLPFDGAIHADTIGYSGGLWVLWNSTVAEVMLTQLAKTEQEIHVTVKVLDSNLTWVLSSIYACPRLAERRLLWNNLSSIASLHHLPWLMVGDFNELLSCNDKQGGNPLNPRRVQLFKDCLDAYETVDLGFHGPKFTLVNKRETGQYIQERLDRAFANYDWKGLYPEASVNHLACTHSDHCPVLLCLDAPSGIRLIRLFRFQPMWLSHPAFPDFVSPT